MGFQLNKYPVFLCLLFAFSCAIKVGNPHTNDGDNEPIKNQEKPAALALSILPDL